MASLAVLLVPWMLVWQLRQPRAIRLALVPVLTPNWPGLPRWLVGSWLERQATRVIRRTSGVDTGFTPALAKIVKYVAIALSVIAVLVLFT